MLQVDGIQAIGGTGALRIGMDLLVNKLGYENIYVSKPTWGTVICFGVYVSEQASVRVR